MRLLAICVVGAVLGAASLVGASEFGCDERGNIGPYSGNLCIGPHIGTPPTCDPVCFGSDPECWPGIRLHLGAGAKFLSCTAGAATQCCNGQTVAWDSCTCACVDCIIGWPEEMRPDYCSSCTPQSSTMVVYTTGVCQRNESGEPVGCQ